MNRIPTDYIERLYAGWLGKLVGIRFGAPIEGWTAAQIEQVYGELNGYPVDYQDFAADDDSNGPLYFLRALHDYGLDAGAREMGLTWLNYVRENRGFFWWGGYGVSTEHTAYLNLRSGIEAPRSGSAAQNGQTMAEQIGGQIFVDAWGLIAPNAPDVAAEYARRASSVSHDGNGVYGGMFVAAAISLAFGAKTIEAVIDGALRVIPADCEYGKMAQDVKRFWQEAPADWRACFNYIQRHYGYDRYPGVCHIIPNGAVIILALLYGGGDFSRTLCVCNMCGWDTDCNAGNVGAIIGVFAGLPGIDRDKWLKPINDFFCASGAVGSLNIVDVPRFVADMAGLAYAIAKEEPPAKWRDFVCGKTPKYHFDLPGSTHGFRARGVSRSFEYRIRQTTETAREGQGCLSFYAARLAPSEEVCLYLKTFYHPSDFHDSRYDPAFSPILYPGEQVRCFVKTPPEFNQQVMARLYVKDDYTGEVLMGKAARPDSNAWTEMTLDIPPGARLISEAGLALTAAPKEGVQDALRLYVDSFDFAGKADFCVDFAKEREEVWTLTHTEIGQMTSSGGIWELADGKLCVHCHDCAEGYFGRHDFANYTFVVTITPVSGSFHHVNFRVQGIIRGYAVAFINGGRLAFFKNENGYRVCCEAAFAWRHGTAYTLRVVAVGANFDVFEGDRLILHYVDTDKPYLTGQVGVGAREGSCALFEKLMFKAI